MSAAETIFLIAANNVLLTLFVTYVGEKVRKRVDTLDDEITHICQRLIVRGETEAATSPSGSPQETQHV